MVFLFDDQIDAAFATRHSPVLMLPRRLPPSKVDFQATFAGGSPWMRRAGGLSTGVGASPSVAIKSVGAYGERDER